MTTQPPSRRERIKTPDAPAAIGPYCQGLLVGDTLYVSGQIALDPSSGEMVEGDVEEETSQILANIGAVLRAADMDFAHVVQVTLFLRDMDDYAVVNEVYARYFSGATPAREALEVGKLPREACVEISCIAVR
ncbi:RidA family protein [Rubrivirga sp.]|uniref:RidA family protein n=1 Tax=Rubrivirga sp. TaxID=1885344 RepID=UPI003B52E77C